MSDSLYLRSLALLSAIAMLSARSAFAELGPAYDRTPQSMVYKPRSAVAARPDRATNAPDAYQVAVIFDRGEFVPSIVRLKSGLLTRLVFASTDTKPAALVVEGINAQRWIPARAKGDANRSERLEVERELKSGLTAEILFEPTVGRFVFHDALSGARGQLIVE